MEVVLYTFFLILFFLIFYISRVEGRKIKESQYIEEYFEILNMPFELRVTKLIDWEQKAFSAINNKKHQTQYYSKEGNIYYLDKLN